MKKKGKKGGTASVHGAIGRASKRLTIRLAFLLTLALAVLVFGALVFVDWPPQPAVSDVAPSPITPVMPKTLPAATFVGSASCASCHQDAFTQWQASQHAVAMQHANEQSVLGDFKEASFNDGRITSRFFRRDGKFMVNTEGPDGALADFEIQYTFGVYPLQQYLITLPNGHVQALTIAWDARPVAEGGQRWHHLYPGEDIKAGDELHWTGRQLNWNTMCADCHSINVHKNYDAATDSYATTWSEISVGCEACHGPASRHLAWAQNGALGADASRGLTVFLDERQGATWGLSAKTGQPTRSHPRTTSKEIEVCAQCHSRRSQLAENYTAGKPFFDHYQPSRLDDGLYFPDGQQRDEVYLWGSFVQSKMHDKGVTCSDCHEPHSQKLRAPGNAVCTQCHAAPRYDAKTHHFHEQGSAGAECASCHMPRTTYMGVDPRRDHRLGIPRPDESVDLGVPNACNACHTEQSPAWAAAAVERWYGHVPSGHQQFAATLAALVKGDEPLDDRLAALVRDPSQPGIARATAVAGIGGYPSAEGVAALRQGLADHDPMVRLATLQALLAFAPSDRVFPAAPLLTDTVRAVRGQAALVLAAASAQLNAEQRRAFEAAAKDYVAAERLNADRPENRTNLGMFFADLGRFDEAAKEYRAALILESHFIPAYVNYAEALRQQGDEAAGMAILREGLQLNPQAAGIHHALGLALSRAGDASGALQSLAKASALEASNARYAYVYGVALNSTGHPAEAISVLKRALVTQPKDREVLMALSLFLRDAGQYADALRYAERLVSAYPEDPQSQQLLSELRAIMAKKAP